MQTLAREYDSRSAGAETGIVTFIQRFGSALNLNIHLHMLVLDGAYTFTHDRAQFHRTSAPSNAELARLLDTLIRRITRTLVRAGVLVEDPEQPWLDLEEGSPLEQLAAAAVRYRITVGPLAGRKTMTLYSASAVARDGVTVKALTAARDGFSLNAAVACEAHQREKLERVCCYVARGPIALERLSVDGDGLVVYQLKHPLRDGTTHVLFEPLDFIARLAALVPRPRTHLVRYHGLFAPNAKHRDHIVAKPAPTAQPGDDIIDARPTTAMSWMQRLRRVFAIDISICPRCGGNVRVIAAITQPALITRILEHRAAGARAPPGASLH